MMPGSLEPTYEELEQQNTCFIENKQALVWSLPMRNWNPFLVTSLTQSGSGLEPTYEELEPTSLERAMKDWA